MNIHQTPLPIYKRPKDDDEEINESISNTPPKGAVPDLKVFENMEVIEDCKTKSNLCPVIMRMVAVLNYYNSLMMNAMDNDETLWQIQIIEFCDVHYTEHWMLEDYIHFVANHSDFASMIKMAEALNWKCFDDVKQCGASTRHYRSRSQAEKVVHFCIEIMDKLHFNVFHLVDVGLRVPSELNLIDNLSDDGLKDGVMLQIAQQIHRERQQTAFPRIDATDSNSKYSLCSNSTVESNDGTKGGLTKMDSVLRDFKKEVGDEAVVRHLVEFMEGQRYDTETMNDDMAVYAESKQCNVRTAMDAHGDGEGFGAIRRWLRYHRVSGSSFSTGKWWAYWPWYRKQTIESLMSDEEEMWNDIDFGGHSLKSLCVYKHFENLKEEVFGSGLISAKFWKSLLQKATRYLRSKRCKQMKDAFDFGGDLKFDTIQGFVVTERHLISLFLYTDSSEYCTALSETFRAIKSGETIEEINARNSMFYWTSRYLRELVFCFGDYAYKENISFFTGISFEMSIPQFKIGLVGPTSTTLAKEVAVRFAGENGMVIVLKGAGSRCFDASVFSAYPEEQERIFFGSTKRETVASIILVKSARNYKVATGAYSKLDAIFSGQEPDTMTDLEMEIISESIQWLNGHDDAVNNKNLDYFILETFCSFVIHKKLVFLDLNWLYRVKDYKIVKLMVNSMWHKYDDTESDKPIKANLIKPLVFTLFRDVHQIRISADYNPFDLMSFLRMLQNVDIPEKLEYILITGEKWVGEGFTGKVKDAYFAEGIIGVKHNKWADWWSLKLNF